MPDEVDPEGGDEVLVGGVAELAGGGDALVVGEATGEVAEPVWALVLKPCGGGGALKLPGAGAVELARPRKTCISWLRPPRPPPLAPSPQRLRHVLSCTKAITSGSPKNHRKGFDPADAGRLSSVDAAATWEFPWVYWPGKQFTSFSVMTEPR